MKVLVLGASGMLGHKLVQIYSKRFEVLATLRVGSSNSIASKIFENAYIIKNIDIENIDAVKEVIFKHKSNVIINAIGIIKQLPTAKNVIKTLSVNSIFPHRLSEYANDIGARLINISTDCVFNGKKGRYIETDVADAEDLHGKSKNLGEVLADNCLTIRTSIIGRELGTSHSLVEWLLGNKGRAVKGYTNAIYTGFPTIVFSEILADLIERFPDLNGLYHISSDPIDKYSLLQLINEAYKAGIEIEPFDEFKIDRSLDSKLFREITGFTPLNWKTMIEKMAQDNAIYTN